MIKGSRFAYLFASWLFLLGVMAQVYLAGMVVVARQTGWDVHIDLGHMLALPLVIMLISMYLGRSPTPMKPLTWLLFVVYVLQADVVIFLRTQLPLISALHPVFALLDFALAVTLAQRAWMLVRQPVAQPAPADLQASPDF